MELHIMPKTMVKKLLEFQSMLSKGGTTYGKDENEHSRSTNKENCSS